MKDFASTKIDIDEVAKIQERREAEIRRQKAENYAKFEKEVTLISAFSISTTKFRSAFRLTAAWTITWSRPISPPK